MNNQTDSGYIQYLPAIYQDRTFVGEDNFLIEFLKIFEKILSGRKDPLSDPLSGNDFESLRAIRGIEEILEDIHDYFDLLYAPEDFIQWLSGWIAFTINEDWPEEKKRRLRAEIVPLYRIRGTLASLQRYLEIYTQLDTAEVQVSEVDGFIIGNGVDAPFLQIGLNTRIGATYPYYFEAKITIPNPADFVSPDFDFKRREVISIIELEKPAYTNYDLRLQVGTMQIGTDTIYAVHFHDQNTGWAVGAGGVILHTLDGGVNWEVQDSGVTDNLYAVHFHDADTGWAAGAGGVILHTSDGSQNWSSQDSGVQTSLYSIYFHDANQGWSVGKDGVILHTADGGRSWTLQNSGVSKTLYSISFPTALRGWAVGEEGTILSTTNSGASWNPQVSGTTENLRAVFSNTLRGWVVGDGGLVLATTNGGTVWNPQNSGVTEALNGVYFRNSSRGWVVGANGVILITLDGGTNWQPLNSGVRASLFNVYFHDNSTGWAVGEGGVLLRTTDGGTNWSVSHSPKRLGHSTIGKDTLLGTFI